MKAVARRPIIGSMVSTTRSSPARLQVATTSPPAPACATSSPATSSPAKAAAATSAPPFRWAGYAAFAWAAAYALFVRGYQGAGGTLGLARTFVDPAAFRRASLAAGVVILLAGVGALAFVRRWGLRLPRWLPIVPALAGSAYAAAHALVKSRAGPLAESDFARPRHHFTRRTARTPAEGSPAPPSRPRMRAT